MRHALFATGLIAGLSLCTAAPPARADDIDPALRANLWHAVTISGVATVHTETLEFDAHRVAGRAACNRFSAGLTQTGSALAIGHPVATRMYCQGRMDDEKAYFDALAAVHGYVLSDGTLALKASDGRVLITMKK
jgi:heat shock protein HslJ